jgi:Protein tyrosine/serine phosphatase
MARTVRASRPIKLDGARNVRDLGGYPTKYGINTATGQFLRADNPSKLTEDDLSRLYDYGVRMQIDFRSPDEIAKGVSKLDGYKDVDFQNVVLLDQIHSEDGAPVVLPALGDMYIGFLDGAQPRYNKILKYTIENHMDSCVFFNCTAGKDRTGTFAMILLKLAGCSDEVVVKDYEVTGDNIWADMEPLIKQYRAAGHELDEDLVKSRPVHMEKALGHLRATYGTIEDWMLKCGLTVAEIDTLRNKILGQF